MIITATGWSLEEIDRMPWPLVTALLRYWTEFPPTHVSLRRIATFLGAVPAERKREEKRAGDDAPPLTDAEAAFISSAKVLPFKKLPTNVQEFFLDAKKRKKGR